MQALETRKNQLFQAIIRQHIALGEPIGSKNLVEQAGLDCSSATVRNTLAELEQEGFLTHPHTSAGRVPTEKGWRMYLQQFMKEIPVSKKAQETLEKAKDSGDNPDHGIKQVAKALAEISQQTAVVGFGPNDLYYTGLSHLFNKPEFAELNLVQRLSEVVDHLDTAMRELFKRVSDNEVQVLIGSENPIDEHCSMLVVRSENENSPLFAVFGPMRMDYDRLLPLVRFTRDLI